ncbi:MAG: cyclic-di-AMP receptor [Chloroflexota bacterium]
MKLIAAMVQDEDADVLLDALMERGLKATKISTTGGFLRSGNTTLLLGVEEHQLEEALGLIKTHCQARTQLVNVMPSMLPLGAPDLPTPVEVAIGGATVFVWDIERYERY